MKIFAGVTLLCCILNGVTDALHWYSGDAATGWTWFFAVSFSVSVALDCLRDLFPGAR